MTFHSGNKTVGIHGNVTAVDRGIYKDTDRATCLMRFNCDSDGPMSVEVDVPSRMFHVGDKVVVTILKVS